MSDINDAATAARALGAHRRRVTTQCEVCGKAIEGTVRRRYCSGACKVRAFRQQRDQGDGERTSDGTVSLVAQLDALRAESQPLDGCVADLLNAAREEQGAPA
jgi:hypothetical protein